ncbi:MULTISPECIES: hypothetical protein [Lacticaseibacillus]|uniref:Uncharacterized protein n=1 Tax=Lacticaseibacillus hegangensis TaxID=2486010 RepID=A0ABW4CZS4_9LACO|nr:MULTISPECIES: hypothetical protein [Lacticaseibacillus]
MAKATRRYFFAARNEKTPDGYLIQFVNMPELTAKGTTYQETVYYAYRVLANFLLGLPKKSAPLSAYTLTSLPDDEPDPNVFYSLVSATEDFDPHKMEMHFTLPQAPPDEIRRMGGQLAHLTTYHQKDPTT